MCRFMESFSGGWIYAFSRTRCRCRCRYFGLTFAVTSVKWVVEVTLALDTGDRLFAVWCGLLLDCAAIAPESSRGCIHNFVNGVHLGRELMI